MPGQVGCAGCEGFLTRSGSSWVRSGRLEQLGVVSRHAGAREAAGPACVRGIDRQQGAGEVFLQVEVAEREMQALIELVSKRALNRTRTPRSITAARRRRVQLGDPRVGRIRSSLRISIASKETLCPRKRASRGGSVPNSRSWIPAFRGNDKTNVAGLFNGFQLRPSRSRQSRGRPPCA